MEKNVLVLKSEHIEQFSQEKNNKTEKIKGGTRTTYRSWKLRSPPTFRKHDYEAKFF